MQTDIDSWQVVTAACVISAVGATVYNILPIFVGSIQDTFQLTHVQAGFIPSAFFAGFGIIAATAYFWIRKVNWKILAFISVPASVMFLLILALISSYISLLIAIMVVGCCFGVMYSLGSTILGDSHNPARYFSFKIGTEILIGAVLLFSLPALVLSRWGFPGLVYTLAGVVILLGFTFVWIPDKGLKAEMLSARVENGEAKPLLPVWCCLSGLLVFFGGMSAVWTFMERMAVDADIAAQIIGPILAVSLVGGLVGAVTAGIIGGRLGRITPPLVGLVLCLIGDIMLATNLTVTTYGIAACIFNVAFAFTLPFLLTLTVDFDFNGRHIVLTVPAISLGIIVGPAFAGQLVYDQNYLGCVVYTGISLILTGVLILSASSKGSHISP